ncbi:MAG: class I SAM-dependent methyltransferase [Peptococcaceae bacterium]
MILEKRIKNYWEGEAQAYRAGIQDELKADKRQTWKKIILENAPVSGAEDKLNVLDIGTGPGFFPIILGEEGHHVTGIDLTENMVECAARNAKREKVKVNLLTMDCHNMNFADESFDLLICRNLTWTLDNPEKAYQEWYRVLRPGGRMLIFDACWYLHLYDEERNRAYQKKEEEILQKYGRRIHEHQDQAEGDALSKKLYMSDKPRPQWDLNIMLKLGMAKVFADLAVSRLTMEERDLELYDFHRPFMVGGEK